MSCVLARSLSLSSYRLGVVPPTFASPSDEPLLRPEVRQRFLKAVRAASAAAAAATRTPSKPAAQSSILSWFWGSSDVNG